ncbi:hypothetical protein E3Q22_02926 [Wallemia mellicola]|uniref:Uncharacterized protein n=1 Tax=Wallemia mellicola TaxID=1708541 RepID=A0A4T0NQB8_9BASI|nr:hypothetical protein E3Q24_02637 [Wallemia mellicola]TIB77625.1 hypothetical protein E3Q22_02926 [Wallemia mellicola]TIB83445.1 hypothetical protein E3Q21_02922 [Wallemia mellicola]TIB86303.1 hypothetical protein E3Q20_02914 [Wallemia mellicola]TIB91053.1 hypothetical protein E3Q19_02591 [Wallemia mellicola]
MNRKLSSAKIAEIFLHQLYYPIYLDRKSASSDEEKSYDSTISQSGDMSWQKATFVLLSETIAIGVLSMPSACRRMGVVSEYRG